ncbi:MAG: L,D-transpeptidase family protein [Chitinispirillales bacterium]|jgi:hypothetical protein|nr:L,D-transpeptidase family protein [Chitinispirillales bacterium]
MYNLLYYIALLKKKIENLFLTYMKKQSIRSAYRGRFYIHPFFILFFTVFAAVVLGIVFISKILSENEKDKFLHVAQVNAELMSDTVYSDAGVDTVSADRFLEPFPIVEGMQNMKYIIVVDKFYKAMYILKQGRKKWGVIKTYPIAMGSSDGRKQREGDKKTPEGLYFVVEKKVEQELNEIYGPHAFVLNYPNKRDITEGRGGSGIWIHGASENTVPAESRGCLSMHNLYIKDLNGIIGDGLLTPVFIVNENFSDFRSMINLEEVWKERVEVAEEFGIDEFGKKTNKANVRKLPDVEIVPITLNAGQQVSVNTRQPTETELEVGRFVNDWAIAWGSKNIQIYQSFYDTQNFIGDGQRWNDWRARKVGTFALYDSIFVTLDRIKVVFSSDVAASVEFVQRYRTERSSVVSVKLLNVVKTDNGWKIISESVKR